MNKKKETTIRSSPNQKTMIILTLCKPIFNGLIKKCFIGPMEIPDKHPLKGKKYYKCGCYKRKLILYDRRVITVIVYRFYCPETKKTYSLLPHFITRYQRHINTVIEDILQRHYAEGTSAENLAEEPSPSPWTIRRWIYKFSKMIVSAENRVEKFLIGNIPSYRVATQNSETMLNKLSEIKRKADLIMEYIKSFDIHLAGAISYYFYADSLVLS